MEWWISPDWSKIVSAPASQHISYAVNGWHGSYPTKAAAQAALNAWNGQGGSQGTGGSWWVLPVPGGIARTGPSANALYQVVQSASRPTETVAAGPFSTKAEAEAWISAKEKSPISPPSPLSGVAAIGDFFAKLGQANTWIRVAEVLLGLGLVIVGLAKLASGTAAGRAALKAGKAAAIL